MGLNSVNALSEEAKQFPMLSTLVNVRERNDLTSTEKVALHSWEKQLLKLSCSEGSYPPPEWVAELVSLAITANKDQYYRILSSYLQLLQNHLPIIKDYHIAGIADLLGLAAQDDWLSLSDWDQIIDILETKSFLFTTKSKQLSELRDITKLWDNLLTALVRTHVVLEGPRREKIERVLSKCHRKFHRAHDKLGQWTVAMARQSLYRTFDVKSEWLRTGVYLLSATKNACMAASAIAVGTTNYGISAIGAIPAVIDMGIDLGRAVYTVGGIIGNDVRQQDWYTQLKELNGILITSTYKAAKAIESGKKNDCVELNTFGQTWQLMCTLTGKEKARRTLYSIREAIIGLIKGFPGDTYTFLHQQLFSVIKHLIKEANDPYLLGLMWGDIANLLSQKSGINLSFLSMCFDLIELNTKTFDKMPFTVSFLEGVDGIYRVLALEERGNENAGEASENKLMFWMIKAEINKKLQALLEHSVNEKNAKEGISILKAIQILTQDAYLANTHELKEIVQSFNNSAMTSEWLVEANKQAHAYHAEKANVSLPSSLVLTTWFILQNKPHVIASIISLLERAGESTAQLLIGERANAAMEENQQKMTTAIGRIGTLSVGVWVTPNGINWTDKPCNKEEAEAMLVVVTGYKKFAKAELDGKPCSALAEEVSNAYVAYYVEGLLQGSNLNQQAIQGAIDLANRVFEEENKQKEIPLVDLQELASPLPEFVKAKQKGSQFWAKLDNDLLASKNIVKEVQDIAKKTQGAHLKSAQGHVKKIGFNDLKGLQAFFKVIEKELPAVVEESRKLALT